MATFRSVEATKLNNISSGTGYTPNPVNEQSAAIRCAYFSYYSSANKASTDVIELCQLPAGARVLGVTWSTNGLGGSCAAKIGDAGDDDRLAVAAASGLATATNTDLVMQVDSTDTDENPLFGYGYRYTADTTILLTFTAASANNGVIRGHIEYTLN